MKKLWFVILLSLSFSLYAGWGADLCEEETCSGHGECQNDGKNEWCECDEGYIADGMECILGCNGVTCSGHGSCSVVSGAEVCSCEAGFYATGLNCILNEASTVDTLAILNETDCYNTGNCHYRLIFATEAYDFTPALSSLYDIIINVLDSENVWHNYRKTVAQCVAESVCDNVDAQYIDFWFRHNVNGNQYVTVELLGNGDDAYDDMYHDVLINYCYGVNCGTGGSCDGTSGYPVCSCEEGYVLRNGICEEGWFEDENLAAAVVELLQYKGYYVETETDIEPEMLVDITHLPLKGKNISSLVGIGLFSSLSVLDVSENNISDLSPLADCSGLKVLNISGNPANDLSPLSNLPLFSVDISYSGVYNLNPLVSVSSLKEIVLADTENGRHGIIRPDNTFVAAWLEDLSLTGCNGLSLYYPGSGRIGEISVNAGCSVHAACVFGQCVCDEGYVSANLTNTCFNPNGCGEGFHVNPDTGFCSPNRIKVKCDDGDRGKIFPDSYLEWNGSEYAYPDGFTNRGLCWFGYDSCSQSVCGWQCRTGFERTGDICVPFAERDIPSGTYNQLMLPNISRHDAVPEPVPGIPSFSPVLKAAVYYDANDSLQTGWHFDLPRVEFMNPMKCGVITCSTDWDKQNVYVYMPWGKEEYSIEAEKKCFNSDDEQVDCKTALNIHHLEVTYYPAPGQSLFSYIVLETRAVSYFFTTMDPDYHEHWKITRYGGDGSVTEFERNYGKRPDAYRFMDYIPISRHITRDKKETSFKYTWSRNRLLSYYAMTSAVIIDPLKRLIKIVSDSGLTGKPDPEYKVLYKPLEGSAEIFTGKADEYDNPEEPLKKVAEYTFSGSFDMTAWMYTNSGWYRKDTYSKTGETLSLSSGTGKDSIGATEWIVTRNGYTERKQSASREYTVKTVSGEFEPWYQWRDPVKYSLSNINYKTETVYYQEKNGTYSNKRIVEDYFTDWLQPAKKVTCERGYQDSDANCSGVQGAVTEEIKYNVSGSPIYFKNADGQVTVNLYDTNSEVNASNYLVHFYSDPGGYTNFDVNTYTLNPNFIRSDNLRRTGTLAYSSVYSLDTEVNFNEMLSQYVSNGIIRTSGWCSNTADRRATNYEWTKQGFDKPYDLKTVTYPDGKVREFTYDYDISSFFQNFQPPFYFAYYTPNGKVWGETITGSNSQNTLQTCYKYDLNYQLTAQGIGSAESCDYKKGFRFDSSGLLMTQDFSYNGNTEVLPNDYIYDSMGRKILERNSAGISTTYVYDSLDRVVFTFFGCKLNNSNSSAFGTRIYEPYNFEEDDSTGENGSGATFQSAFPYSDFTCEYYRKYKYDAMSNLTGIYFFEYWGVNQNNQIIPLTSPKIIKQETEYDMLSRAVKSCQFDATLSEPDKRCIETEHDIFGNITKKTENGEERVITYDLRNRPMTVTVDGLLTEEYFYHNETCGTYCGYDEIANKYGTTNTLKTYKDRWGRVAKSVDPFGNNVEPHYNSATWLTDYSKTYNGTTLTSFDAYEYDDLGRIFTVKKVLFDPASNTSNAAATSISGIAAKEMVLEKSVSYDPVTGSIVSIEDSFGNETVKVYDSLNRVVKVENYDADNQLVSSVRTAYDAAGRISAVQDWTSAKTTVTEYEYDKMGRVIATCVKTANAIESQDCLTSSCSFDDEKCSYQLYNTGGQVVWSADTETGGLTDLLTFLENNLTVGNETVYDYNAFGEVITTARRMTANGSGGGLTETQLYNSDAWITTNFTYDIFGRNTEKADDNGAKTHYTYTANNLPETEKYCGSDDSDCDYPREVTYTYNSKRDLVSETYEQEGISLTVNYGRDDYGRISQKYTGTTSNDVYQTFTYNVRNLLETAKSVDPTNTTSTLSEVTRTYDSFGNIKSETFDSGTVSSAIAWNPTTKVMTETITLPSGKNIVETTLKGLPKTLEYDGAKLLQYNYGTGNVLTSIRKNFDLQDNHAAELSYTYNNWRKVSLRTEEFTAQNAPTVADYEYTYSKGLHLIGKQENEENRRTAYQYDSYYRLRRVDYDCAYSSSDPTCIENRTNVFKCNSSETDCEDFQLDGVHNIRASRENQTDFSWTVDGFNRLTQKSWNNDSVTYSYDSNNNMTGEDLDGDQNADIVYTYDKLNRLTSVTNANYFVEYSYDPFNRRTEKTVYYTENSDTFERTHKYTYDGWDIISEEIKTVRTSDTPAAIVAWQLRRYVDQGTDNHIIMDTVLCSDDGNGNCSPNESTLQRIWFHKDERGNVIAVSDGNGTIYERYRYRVYGEHEVLNADFSPKSTAALSPFLWGGSLYEPETNLYWMRNRYYHIDMHRFINQDPIGIWGDANNLGNGFAYVAGMVIEASDPSGLYVVIVVKRIFENDTFISGILAAFSTTTFEEFSGYTIENKSSPRGKPASPGVYEAEARLRYESPRTHRKFDPPRINYTSRGHQIHNGNSYTKSDGCILLGNQKNAKGSWVGDSVNAVKTLNSLAIKDGGPIFVVILPTGYESKNINDFPPSNFFDLYDLIKGFNDSKNNKNSPEQFDEKEKTDPESKPLENKDDDESFGTNPIRSKYPEADVECSYGSCQCVSGNCSGATGENTPSDPDQDPSNAIQRILMTNILAKMLKRGESEQPPVFVDNSTGPNGAIMIYKNPYYVNKDPLKTILFDGDNGSGKPMIYRNPCVPGAEYGYDSTTYEKFQQAGFPQTNVDPYWY